MGSPQHYFGFLFHSTIEHLYKDDHCLLFVFVRPLKICFFPLTGPLHVVNGTPYRLGK